MQPELHEWILFLQETFFRQGVEQPCIGANKVQLHANQDFSRA